EKLQLFHKLDLETSHHNNLRAADILQITAHSLQSCESCAEEELVQTFIQKLLMMNYRARYLSVEEVNEQDQMQQRNSDSSEDESDIFTEMSFSNKRTSQSGQIHLMDVQMAVFHCADGFLKQLMVTKLSQCQYALPLLVPDPFTQQIEFPLWTFRQINKSWKMRNSNDESISQTQPIYKAETPMVFFFRFGSVSSSKSQLMNSLINERHNTFFHRNCPGSSRTRVLMDGVVEIAWFCPCGKNTDKFTNCVAFCNLHGDAGDHEKQLQILTEMASVNVVLLPRLDRDSKHAAEIQKLYKDPKPLICLIAEDISTIKKREVKYKIGLNGRNQSDVSEELRRTINDCLSKSSSFFRLKDVCKHSDIRVDEEDDDDCRRGREAAQQMMSLLEKKDLTEIKESYLPHQGKLWHQWSQKNKELHRPRADEIEMEIGRQQTENIKIRQQQQKSDIKNPSEMQDILQIVVQAFMRMKKVRLNPSCVFVHQNVSDVTAGEKNENRSKRMKEKLDEMTKLAAEDKDSNDEYFSEVIEFDVHNNVKYIAQLWEGSPPMAPPNPNYCENIQELKKTIMAYASKSHGMMLIDLKVRIRDLWEALLNEQFVSTFSNSLEVSAYRKLETKYSKWSWSLCSAMMKIENKVYNKIKNEDIHKVEEINLQSELKTTCGKEVEQSMSEFFETDKYILNQWKPSFEIKIKELQENIVRETKRKLNEILLQRDLKKKTDDKKTHHENTLYEKSIELALKLKDKTNDEETMKKEFDLFWEQSVKKIKDNPPIKDIDIMKDVTEILSNINESHPLDHWRDIFLVLGYTDYVQVKQSSGYTRHVTNIYRSAIDRLGYTLFKEDESQIRSLVTDVVHQTDRMILSFNISKMGYNISCIQQLIDYIKRRITEHQERAVNYVFKNEFFVDLVFSICKRANEMITDKHELFREANDLVIFVEKKREQYYSIFQKYCHGASSSAIFGEIICQKLKEHIEQSVYNKTSSDLADEIRINCESLNGNRSNLEKHILKTLAEEEDFDKYMNYIKTPRDHFKSFIRDE
ncbi:hypothetical protein QQF64_034267, partial [Cirrhinus molitorella]